jgi:hypothetical protein
MEARMYGVRIIVDGEIADLKVFDALPGAQERFRLGWAQAYDGEFDSIAIFNVPEAQGVREAAEAIRSGDKQRIELIDIQESQAIMLSRLAKQIRIEI